MKRCAILILALIALLASGCRETPRPNIVLVVADDLGYGDLGSYGQKNIRTPVLDGLARQGMRFTDHYAGSTVCAPSRSALMTGQHTGHTPIRGNSEVKPMGQRPLSSEVVTLAETLHGGRYRTGLIGKWGIGGGATPKLVVLAVQVPYPALLCRVGFRDESRVRPTSVGVQAPALVFTLGG